MSRGNFEKEMVDRGNFEKEMVNRGIKKTTLFLHLCFVDRIIQSGGCGGYKGIERRDWQNCGNLT
ncbi:MAG: hypothetical protein IJ716_04140 [Lachnospiraceae bacterium]|nr:hypothetical protein [Lachnospiraceae bacterium]